MKTKSLLSFLAAWTIFLALTFFAGPSATKLYAQDDADKKVEADEDKEDEEKEDEEKEGADKEAPSPGGGSLIQADVSQGESTANIQSLSSLNIDFETVNSSLEASGSSMESVFGSDYAGVAAILSAGGAKQTAIEGAINTAFSTNAAGIRGARLRRDGSPTADQLDTIADVALLENLVNFAIDVAAP
ncbi:MAG: hypothetical protein VB997_02175, partial [Opitutales bacterium]